MIVDEHGDTEVYADVAAAAAGLEAIDVRNAEYEAFDSSGRPLDLYVVDGRAVLRLREDASPEVEDVVNRLRRAARAIDARLMPGLDIERADLRQLVDALLAVEAPRLTWRRLLRSRRTRNR